MLCFLIFQNAKSNIALAFFNICYYSYRNRPKKIKMKNKIIRALKKDSGLLGAGIIFMIGSFFVSGLNYLYHLIIARLLGPKEYSTLGSLFSIIYIAMFTSSTFSGVLSKFSAEYSSENKEQLSILFQKSFFKALFYGFWAFIAYAFFSPGIANYLNLENRGIFSIIIVGLIAYMTILSSIIIGVLNGTQNFVWQNLTSFVSAIIKFVLGVTLVYIGFGVSGALAGIFFGILISIFFSLSPISDFLKKRPKASLDTKKIYRFAGASFLSSFVSSLIINIDLIFAKHYLADELSGLYAAASMLAKIILFGSGFFSAALFPKIIALKNKNSFLKKKILIRALEYTFALASLGSLAYFIMPKTIVLLLYGSEYLAVSKFIGLFGLSLGLYSISRIFIAYCLALDKYSYIWILAFALAIEILLIIMFHNGLFDIIMAVFAANIASVIGLGAYTFMRRI